MCLEMHTAFCYFYERKGVGILKNKILAGIVCVGVLGMLIACGKENVAPNDGTETVSADNNVNAEEKQEQEKIETDTAKYPDVSKYECVPQAINFTAGGDLFWKQEGVEYGELVEIEYESFVTGKTRKANVLLPAGYTEEKQYPVLYLLHGSDGDHNEWKKGDPVYTVGNAIASGEAAEMIVVMPNVRASADDSADAFGNDTLGNFRAFDNFINDLQQCLMPYIEENYPVYTDRDNTAVAGLSLGGRESIYIGRTLYEEFAYIGSFSPGPGVVAYKMGKLMEEGLFEAEELAFPEGYEPKVLMITEGDSDSIVGKIPHIYHDLFTEAGVDHIYYTIKGGHDYSVWKRSLYGFIIEIF